MSLDRPSSPFAPLRACCGRLLLRSAFALMAGGLCLWAAAGEAYAGRNAGAYADCSWRLDEVSRDRSLLPLGPFPLYVRLHNVASVRAIGIHLRWFPRTIGNECYEIVDGAAGDSCGVLLNLPPNATSADTGYTGVVRFTSAPVEGEACLVAWVAHEGCSSLEAARFYVASLMLEDAEGERDLVPIVNEVTILGGESIEQPPTLQSSGRMWLIPGFVNSFHVLGIGFDSTTTVSLVGAESTVAAAVSLDDSRSLSVAFDLPETFAGAAILVLGGPSGPTDTLAMALSVQDTSAATGTGTNGTDHAMDKLTSGGALRKLPGDSTWTFIPALPESALSLPCMRSAPLVSSAPSATRDHADRSTPLRTSTETNVAARTASGARPLAVQSDYYDKTPLFSEGFENGAVTQNTWVSTGTLDAPQWGRATNSCAKVFAGGWSESPVGNPGSGAPYCFGYSGVPNPANGTELSQINSITIGHYKAAELSFWRWIDTYSDNSSWDALYLFYSTDGGSHYVNASGANGIAGEDRLWRRELLTLDTQGGLTQQVRLLFKFLPMSGAGFTALPNDSGVFVDNVAIDGVPYPNLTFWRPNSPGNDWTGPLILSAHPNLTYDEPVTMGQTCYFRYGLTNNSYSRADAQFHVSLWVAGLGFIDDRYLGPWAPGQTWYSPSIPASIPPNFCGQHEVRLYIDDNDEVREQDEGNQDNSYARYVEWTQPSLPDLRVTSAWASPTSACAGTSLTLHAVVQNAGTAAAASAELRYSVQSSAQDACGAGSSMGVTRYLAPGASDTLEVVVNSTTAATRWYTFAVDCTNAVNEGCPQAEANNACGPLGVTWLPAGADLAVTDFYAGRPPVGPLRPDAASARTIGVDGTAPVGTSVPVTITVRNLGLVSTPTYWDLAWYQDLAHAPTASDPTTLRYTMRRALGPGEDTTITFPVTSSLATTWRMYTLANRSGAVDECQQVANNMAGPFTLVWTTDSLVVQGRFTFRDTGYVRAGTRVALGAVHPLRAVRVEIWDENEHAPDSLLGTTCTDEVGAFALALPSRYDQERGPIEDAPQHVVDIYARAVLLADSVCAGIPAVEVAKWSNDSTWTFSGPVRMDVLDPVLDFGEISPPLGEASYGHRSAMHIYDTILRGAKKMQSFGFAPVGASPPHTWRTFVKWEPGGGSCGDYDVSLSRRDTIWIVGAKYYKGKNPLTPDEWDDCLLLHEYAHQVANKGGFSWTPSSGDTCATHTFGRPAECPIGTPSPGYAWNEGWADFLGALLGDVGTGSLYIDYGYNGQDSLYLLQLELESGERYEGLPFSPPRANLGHAGPSYEAANAGALWDWVDSSNDDEDPTACADHFTDGFDRMLNRLLTDQALGLDSLANVYMVYQHHELAGDLPRARALFEVLCDHGWWRAGADSDTVEVVSVASGNLSSPRLMLAPTPSQGRVVFSVAATPSEQPPVIEVFDIAGRVIWRAMTRRIDDGLWRVVWDTRTNAGETARSGVYFARCRVSGTCLRHTLVVMR